MSDYRDALLRPTPVATTAPPTLTERQLTAIAEGALEFDDPRARAAVLTLIREVRRFPIGAMCFKDLPEGARFRLPADESPIAGEVLTKIAPLSGASTTFRANARGHNDLICSVREWELVLPLRDEQV